MMKNNLGAGTRNRCGRFSSHVREDDTKASWWEIYTKYIERTMGRSCLIIHIISVVIPLISMTFGIYCLY